MRGCLGQSRGAEREMGGRYMGDEVSDQGRGRKARVERRSVGSQKNPVTPDCFTLPPPRPRPPNSACPSWLHAWLTSAQWEANIVAGGRLRNHGSQGQMSPLFSGCQRRRKVLKWGDKHTSDRHACICMYSRQFANLEQELTQEC